MDIGFGYKNLVNGLKMTSTALSYLNEKNRKRKEMKQKTYILQKNIPFFDKGTEIKPTSALAYGLSMEGVIFYEWSNGLMQNNPEYFKLKEEKEKIDVVIVDFEKEENGYYKYRFMLTNKIYNENGNNKIDKIYNAIQKIVNDD